MHGCHAHRASRTSKFRWIRRLAVVSVVSVLLISGIAQASSLGWWNRATYNGYALCGYEYTGAVAWPTSPAYGYTITQTRVQDPSNPCYREDLNVEAN